jgi:hypothetical protein
MKIKKGCDTSAVFRYDFLTIRSMLQIGHIFFEKNKEFRFVVLSPKNIYLMSDV